MRNQFTAILLVAIAAGCASQFRAGGAAEQKNSSDSSPGSGKPSDESEGVPGYLTDPGSVQAVQDQNTGAISVQGAKGAVTPASGETLGGLLVAIWTLPQDDFAQARQGTGTLRFGGTQLGTAPVANDGSFTSTGVKVPDGNVLVIAVAKPGAASALTVPPLKSGQYSAAVDDDPSSSGVFSRLAATPSDGTASNLDLSAANVPILAQDAIQDCLFNLYGAGVDVSKLGSYRALAVDALTYSGGNGLNDPGSGKAEIVHVTMNGLFVSNLEVSLQNAAATYCLDVHALTFSASTINVNCKAKYYDGSETLLQSGVQINKTGC